MKIKIYTAERYQPTTISEDFEQNNIHPIRHKLSVYLHNVTQNVPLINPGALIAKKNQSVDL